MSLECVVRSNHRERETRTVETRKESRKRELEHHRCRVKGEAAYRSLHIPQAGFWVEAECLVLP